MDIFSRFFKKKIYYGDVVDLKEKYSVDKYSTTDGVGTIYYDIYLHENNNKIGSIELRDRANDDMYYYGNVGYNIITAYRGHSYAYYACKMLMEIAKKEYGMKELIITCSPDNIASYKTLIKLGGKLVETVNVPSDHYLYKHDEKVKCIFMFERI